jgi:hypothetical protein
MINRIKNWFRRWCKKHIADDCTQELEDYEFGDKWKNLK